MNKYASIRHQNQLGLTGHGESERGRPKLEQKTPAEGRRKKINFFLMFQLGAISNRLVNFFALSHGEWRIKESIN
jgi:hypothetical protein